jgi:pSer/pThr/pTyr-binding forkhead associated (FHA) protein
MACLIITHGEPKGSCFKLEKLPLTAGREPTRDIQILDPKVSRRHFTIRKDGDAFVISELDAKNGVYVNSKKVAETKLADGDRIVVGETELTFLATDDPARIDALNRMRQYNTAAKAPTMM